MFFFTYTAAVLAIICFGIAAFILLKSRRNPLAKYFGLYVLCVGIWVGANALADIATTDFTYRLWANLAMTGGVFFISFYICFAEYLISGKPLKKLKKALFFLPAIIFSILGFTTKLYVAETILLVDSPSQNTMGVLNTPIFIYVFGVLIFGFVRLLINISKTSYQKKQQSIYIAIGFFIILSAAAISSMILPFFGIYEYYTTGPQFAIFMILLAAYAVFKHCLLDIKLIIQKSVIYLILVGSVIGIYLAIICLVSSVATHLNSSFQPYAVLIAALFGAVGVPPLKKYLKRKTDKLFFKDHMPYSDAVHELSQSMNLNLELKDLLNYTTESLYKVFKPKKITIYLKREKLLYERNAVPELKKGVITKITDFGQLPDDDDKLYINAEHDGMTLAQIIIDEKKSGDIYLPEDRSILTTFSYQFAMALEKTNYYEKVKKRAERLKEKTLNK
jgi:hypothetical protein